jgi:hypothetical protein
MKYRSGLVREKPVLKIEPRPRIPIQPEAPQTDELELEAMALEIELELMEFAARSIDKSTLTVNTTWYHLLKLTVVGLAFGQRGREFGLDLLKKPDLVINTVNLVS